MTEADRLQSRWAEYVATQDDPDLPERPYPTGRFGDSPEMADELGQLILDGRKTATCSAQWEYEADGDPPPKPGERLIVLDGRDLPICIIETTEVEGHAFDEVDARFARDEGEGDRTLEHWRREHRTFFSRILPRVGREFSEDMPLLCERFRMIHRW